jgi:predicted pyridoxine 5'-phosphate oxidase superfamily flavin-nucleotide-binding protein
MTGFLDIAVTPSVAAAQAANGSGAVMAAQLGLAPFEGLTEAEVGFITARDSFYMASVSETGWPYVQHRGGAPGFLRVIDARTLAFADYRGNRQYVSLGNLSADARACLILMDYANQARLKLYVTVEVRDLAADPALAERLATPGYRARPERAMVLRVEASDWNCAQHITQRFTLDQLEPLRLRMEALASENQRLRAQLAEAGAAIA